MKDTTIRRPEKMPPLEFLPIARRRSYRLRHRVSSTTVLTQVKTRENDPRGTAIAYI